MKILKIPYPYKCWLSISNDPDNTSENAWVELNNFIFEELNLNWANSIFPVNRNLNLPDQVSLEKHPFIASQPADTIHTWGDFVHSGSHGFSRIEADYSLKLLKNWNINPRIWVDHSRFLGNLIHGKINLGGKKSHVDASGIRYLNYEYTADMIHDLGIRYIWDGELTPIIGQNRKLSISDIKQIGLKNFIKAKKNNKLLKRVKFEEYEFYSFKRYGNWKLADILGLSQIITEEYLLKLISTNSFSIIYTHLGKRNPNQKNKNHIPQETIFALKNLIRRINNKEIIFTPVSKMLDYNILISNLVTVQDRIYFNSDKIRFDRIIESDLSGFSFSFVNKKEMDIENIQVFIDNKKSNNFSIKDNNNIITICFI
jgi:hypothetical protein